MNQSHRIMRLAKVLFSLFPLWIFAFLFKAGAGLHYTLIPTLGERVFPLWAVGLLIGGAALVQAILDVPAGYLLDRFGYVKLMKMGTTCFIIGALSFVFGLTIWTYLFNIALSIIGWLFFGPGVDAYVLVMAPKKIAGTFMAMRDMVESGGIVAGMGLLSLVVHLPTPLLGLLVAFILMVGLIALWKTPPERGSVHQEKKIAHHSFYIRRSFIHHIISALKKLNPASGILLLSALSGATFYGIVWFVIPILIARNIEHSGILGFGLTVFDLAVLIIGYAIGRATDRWDKRWLIFWGLLLFGVMAFLLGFHFGILFLVFGFLATTGDEMSSVSLWAWMDHLDKEHSEDALISGIISLAQDIGWTIGPIAAGFLMEYTTPSWTIASGALLIFVTWTIASIVTGLVPNPPHLIPVLFHIPRRKRHKR